MSTKKGQPVNVPGTKSKSQFGASPEKANELKSAFEAIDWSKIDFGKLAMIFQLIFQIFQQAQPLQATSEDMGHATHEDCCLQTLQASLCATNCAAHAYQTCLNGDDHVHGGDGAATAEAPAPTPKKGKGHEE